MYYCDSDAQFWDFINTGWQTFLLLWASINTFQIRKAFDDIKEAKALARMIYFQFTLVILRLTTFFLSDKINGSVLQLARSIIYSIDVIGVCLIYFLPKFIMMKKIEESTRDSLTHSAHWRRVQQAHQHAPHPFVWASRLISNLASMVVGVEDVARLQDGDRIDKEFDVDNDDIEVDTTSYAVDGLGDRIYPESTSGVNAGHDRNGRGNIAKNILSKSSESSPSKCLSSRSGSGDKSASSLSGSQQRLTMRGSSASTSSKSSSNNDNGALIHVGAAENENRNGQTDDVHHEISSADMTMKVEDSDDSSFGDGGDSSTLKPNRVLKAVIEEEKGVKEQDEDAGTQVIRVPPTNGTSGGSVNDRVDVSVPTDNRSSKGTSPKETLLAEQDKDLRILRLERELRTLKEQLKVKDA